MTHTSLSLSRRGFLQIASGLLVPAPPRERAYSFAGGWMGPNLYKIDGVWRPLLFTGGNLLCTLANDMGTVTDWIALGMEEPVKLSHRVTKCPGTVLLFTVD